MPKRTKLQTAVHDAIEALDFQIQRYAPNANLYALHRLPSGRSDFEKRERYRRAKAALLRWLSNPTQPDLFDPPPDDAQFPTSEDPE